MCSCSNNNFNTSYSSNSYDASGYNSVNYNYARSYVPSQVFRTTFSPMEGLANGTMFPELVRPYYPSESLETINYLRSNRGGCR